MAKKTEAQRIEEVRDKKNEALQQRNMKSATKSQTEIDGKEQSFNHSTGQFE